MFSILIVNNKNITKPSLIEALETFPNISITQTQTIDEALELFSKRYFEILFLDSCLESAKSVEKFIKNSPNIIIVGVCNKINLEMQSTMLKAGVIDCLYFTLGTDLLRQRVSNYMTLSKLKKQNLFNGDIINLFNEKTNRHFITFKLDSSESKLEFWDYFSSSYFQRYENINESIDLLYAFTSWMFMNKRHCEVIKETYENNMYLTLQPIDFMSQNVIENLILKHCNANNYKINNHRLSLKFTDITTIKQVKTTSKLDEETKSILYKTHVNKITAHEFMQSTALEFVNKLEDLSELEDEIDEAIHNFEDNPSVQATDFLSLKIMEYVEVIEMLMDFDHLAYALKTLANAIQNISQKQMKEKEIKKFTTLTLHLLNDLSSWRDNVFVKQEANDIHYLDSSLLSSCLQIEAIFKEEKIEESDDDFELF